MVTQKQLNQNALTPGIAIGTLYTVPSNTKATIQTVSLCNTTASAATVTLYRVPVGSAAGKGNMVVSAYSVPANSTVFMDNLRWVQEAGSTIQAVQGTDQAINVFLDGVEVA